MSIVVTVNIEADIATVERVEKEHPEVIGEIGTIAERYMTGHRRTVRPGRVLDIDEFASESDYRTFIAEAGDAIKRYGDLIGVAPHDTVWAVS